MAGAIIIACAIGVLLLVLVGYVIVGGTLASADSIASAQKDMVMKNGEQLNTLVTITPGSEVYFDKYSLPPDYYLLHIHVKNTGNLMLSTFDSAEVYVNISGGAPVRYTFDPNAYACGDANGCGDATLQTWNDGAIENDVIHPKMLDPGETLSIRIGKFTSPLTSYTVKFTTANGVSAFYNK
jgi:flagellar protein FlaF